MLMLLQQAVKHLTPLWQRNLSLLLPVSLTGTTLSESLFLNGSTSMSTDSIFCFFLSFMIIPSMSRDRGRLHVPLCFFTPNSELCTLNLSHPPLNLLMLLSEKLDALVVRPQNF